MKLVDKLSLLEVDGVSLEMTVIWFYDNDIAYLSVKIVSSVCILDCNRIKGINACKGQEDFKNSEVARFILHLEFLFCRCELLSTVQFLDDIIS